MSDHRAFGRKLKELAAGQNQIDVAAKLGYTAPRVSQIMRGERPSREFVERLIEAYDLPRDEWLEAAGFTPPADAGLPPSHDLRELARLTAEETVKLLREPQALTYEPDPDSTHFAGLNLHGLTPEQAQQAIELFARQREEERGVHE